MQTAEKHKDLRQDWCPTPEKIDLAVKTAIEATHPSRIFIFGSWARGESKDSSDLDLAILVQNDRKNELDDLRTKIRRELNRIPMSIDLIVASEEYAAEFISSVNSIYYKILHRGKLVYDSGNR